jgi:tetratricopeptide (TPR) repeat protein
MTITEARRTQKWFKNPAFVIPVCVITVALLAYSLKRTLDPVDAPKRSRQLAAKGHSLMLSGSHVEARAVFDEAVSFNPTNIVALRGAVWSRIALDEHEAALEHTETALWLYPTDMYLLDHQGDVLSKLGRWNEAIAAYQECIDTDPSGYWEPWIKLAAAQIEIGDLIAAADTYHDLLSRYSGHVKAQEALAVLEERLSSEHQ